MSGEVLNIEQPAAFVAYLRQCQLIAPDEQPDVCPLAGGVSNRTMLVVRPGGEAWVAKQALAQLRVQAEWFCSPERIHREAAGLRWLNRLLPAGAIPDFVHEDHDQHLLIMEAVPQPHWNWKQLLLAGDVQPAHVAQFGSLLGLIHSRAYHQREAVAEAFADTSYFASLRLEPYYRYTATQVPEAAAFYAQLIDSTCARRLTLVHGDYSPKNVLVHGEHLVLLDHEVIHFGDPAFDLGFAMTHLLSKAHHLPAYRSRFASAALLYWAQYQAAVGDVPWQVGLEAQVIRHTLGCLLARVAGRSPLEYLAAGARARQQAVTLALMAAPPPTVAALVQDFVKGIGSDAVD